MLWFLETTLSGFLNRVLSYLILACSAATTQIAHPFQILFGDTRNLTRLGGSRGLVYHQCRIWLPALHRLKASPIHTNTPLWDNFNIPELLTLPNVDLWINQEVICLQQVKFIPGSYELNHSRFLNLPLTCPIPCSLAFSSFATH